MEDIITGQLESWFMWCHHYNFAAPYFWMADKGRLLFAFYFRNFTIYFPTFHGLLLLCWVMCSKHTSHNVFYVIQNACLPMSVSTKSRLQTADQVQIADSWLGAKHTLGNNKNCFYVKYMTACHFMTILSVMKSLFHGHLSQALALLWNALGHFPHYFVFTKF